MIPVKLVEIIIIRRFRGTVGLDLDNSTGTVQYSKLSFLPPPSRFASSYPNWIPDSISIVRVLYGKSM